MLDHDELADVAARFGVADEQVRRDHLISHLLAAMARLGLEVTFFGGTALARTYLDNPEAGGRLSEDIDLIAANRRQVARLLDDELPHALRRDFPQLSWAPPLSTVRAVEPAQLAVPDGLSVRMQVLSAQEHHELAAVPTEVRPVVLRYADLPATAPFRVPTLAGAVAMKVAAWRDRRTSRDLYDLAMLARIGGFTIEVDGLVRRLTGVGMAPPTSRRAPGTTGASSWLTRPASCRRPQTAWPT